jgi:hypothetical protein
MRDLFPTNAVAKFYGDLDDGGIDSFEESMFKLEFNSLALNSLLMHKPMVLSNVNKALTQLNSFYTTFWESGEELSSFMPPVTKLIVESLTNTYYHNIMEIDLALTEYCWKPVKETTETLNTVLASHIFTMRTLYLHKSLAKPHDCGTTPLLLDLHSINDLKDGVHKSLTMLMRSLRNSGVSNKVIFPWTVKSLGISYAVLDGVQYFSIHYPVTALNEKQEMVAALEKLSIIVE